MLDKEFKFFQENQSSLFKLYPNKYIVINEGKVHCSADTFESALELAVKKLAVGTFIIQLCSEGKEGYTQTFHSRVIFA